MMYVWFAVGCIIFGLAEAPAWANRHDGKRPTAKSGFCPEEIKASGETPEVFVDFMGKSVAIPRDVGIMQAMHQQRVLQGAKLSFAGNSSGALLAGFFACWGVSNETLAEAERHLVNFDYSIVAADWIRKRWLVASGYPAERQNDKILPLINTLTKRKGKECIPTQPLIIGATNGDVVDQKLIENGKTRPFKSLGDKSHDENWNVYKRGKFVGKPCTYFVSQPSYENLSKIPYEQRLCELRLIETAEDLRLAMLASISEPTYFVPVSDPYPDRIHDSAVSDHSKRSYVGGFSTPVLTEDFKRVNPRAYTIGTGMDDFSDNVDSVLQNWYLISPMASLKRGRQSLNLEFPAKDVWKERNKSARDWLKEGRSVGQTLIETFSRDCFPDSYHPNK